MVLSDKELKRMIMYGTLIGPIDNEQIQPASIDLRIGNFFLKPVPKSGDDYNAFDKQVDYESFVGEYILKPHEFVLATTLELVNLPNNLTAFVEGRSSIGRMGLFVQNAGWVDPGFTGEITLELFNASEAPIKLIPNTRVAQLVFCTMSESCDNPYNGKYQFQKNAVGSRINLDMEVLNKKEVTNND